MFGLYGLVPLSTSVLMATAVQTRQTLERSCLPASSAAGSRRL